MNSTDNPARKSVDAYIAKAPEYARPICAQLRALVRKAAPELSEALKWGMPTFIGRGMVCGFAAFKAHVRFHFFKGTQLADEDGLLTDGEGNASGRAMNFSAGAKLPVKALEKLVREAAKLDASGEAKSAPRATRADLPMPDDLAAAIQKVAKARAHWETLPPSCRREYIEWIISAKREETRARRLASAVEMLTAGRRYNDQYR
jgi:hypothetical protein